MDTILRLGTRVVPIRSSLDCADDLAPVGGREVRRTLTGAAIALGPVWGTRYRVTISSGTVTWRSPALDGLQTGDPVEVDCLSRLTAQILAGATSTTLSRDAVPGSVEVRRAGDGVLVPHTLVGRVVTIAAQAVDVVVEYRPRLQCVFVEASFRSTSHERLLGWTLTLEEAA